jgi:multiple sugar transport system permease protein
LVQFITTWNDYMGPLLYMEDFPTLSSGLYEYRVYSVERKGNYPIYFAGLLITVTPVLVLYSIFSETIMTNMGVGGLKG